MGGPKAQLFFFLFTFCINSALWGEGDVVEFYLDLTKKDWPMNSIIQ